MADAWNRHALRLAALRRVVFDSTGETEPAVRRAAGSGDPLPEPWDRYARSVRDTSYRLTDADIEQLRAAGCSEEAIFEVTIAAATGAALRRLDAGLRALGGTP
jgi:hypothetical protein